MKILLVSDTHAYSTLDVFLGYIKGFNDLNIPFEVANFNQLLQDYSVEMALGLITSKMLIKENGFTHVLFVAGTMIPRWVLESKYDKKIGYISTDDPHSSRMLVDNLDLIDYYFCNEKTLLDYISSNKLTYLPTAVSVESIERDKAIGVKQYKSDIVFLGSIYPNRVKPLELVLEYATGTGKKCLFIGPNEFVPKKSTIYPHIINTVTDNKDTLKFYANSKCVINLRREKNWSPCFKGDNPHLLNKKVTPYSTNPRTYEAAICKTPQLLIEPRREAVDIFGDNAFYANNNPRSIFSALDAIFKGNKKELNKKVKVCYDIVVNKHTYTHRTAKILETLIRK